MDLKPSPIVLDKTLHELYSLGNQDTSEIALVYVVPTAEVQLKTSMPLSTKFIYQAPLSGPEDSAILARCHLQIVPQLYGFIAGKLQLYLFDLDSDDDGTGDQTMMTRADVSRVFEALSAQQRPRTKFIYNPSDIHLECGTSAAIISPMDCLTHLPLLVDPERHYTLQSKRALAMSNVPTPPTVVLDSDTSKGRLAKNEQLLDAEVERMIQVLRERDCPFVVKMQQSLASQGTFVVTTENDKVTTLETLFTELRRVLLQQNPSNYHLHSASLVIQEMIKADAVALFIFITKAGDTVFLGCCEQLLDEKRQWIGGCISYDEHDELSRAYSDIANQVGHFAHQNGYFGPMGVDVMTGADGKHLAIDPNPRVSGSAPLCLLRQHFFQTRGLSKAALFFPVFITCTRDEFEQRFRREMVDGSLVIIGWSRDELRGYSASAFILAARSTEELQAFRNQVAKYEWV